MLRLAPAFAVSGAALLTVTTTAPVVHTEAKAPKAPKAFVALSDVDRTIRQDIRYITRHNFVGERINGYRQPMCILTRPAAKALHKAQQRLLRKGYTVNYSALKNRAC